MAGTDGPAAPSAGEQDSAPPFAPAPNGPAAPSAKPIDQQGQKPRHHESIDERLKRQFAALRPEVKKLQKSAERWNRTSSHNVGEQYNRASEGLETHPYNGTFLGGLHDLGRGVFDPFVGLAPTSPFDDDRSLLQRIQGGEYSGRGVDFTGNPRLDGSLLGMAASEGAMGKAFGRSPSQPRPIVPSRIENIGVRVGPYKALARELSGTEFQANHLNQNAVYGGIIPEEEGISVESRGNAFHDPNTPHYDFHTELEGFWEHYRKPNELYGTAPTSAQYDAALRKALARAGYPSDIAARLADRAAAQRLAYGLLPEHPVPKIPRRLYRKAR
jgi:hypothetical protein